MPHAFVSAVIPGEVHDVWEVIRPFNGTPRWNPGIVKSELVQGHGQAEVGSIRRMTNARGSQYIERLVALNDEERYLTYNLIEGRTLKIRRYISTMRLYPVTESNQTFLVWESQYDTDTDTEAETYHQLVGEIYKVGIEGLKQHFASRK